MKKRARSLSPKRLGKRSIKSKSLRSPKRSPKKSPKRHRRTRNSPRGTLIAESESSESEESGTFIDGSATEEEDSVKRKRLQKEERERQKQLQEERDARHASMIRKERLRIEKEYVKKLERFKREHPDIEDSELHVKRGTLSRRFMPIYLK